MTTVNCATGTIAPYVPSGSAPWNKLRAQHLYRRTGFGANLTTINAAVSQNPLDLVDAIIDQGVNAAPIPQPVWAFWNETDYSDFDAETGVQQLEWMVKWVEDMLQNGLRGRLTLFWHNHFVTKLSGYLCPSYMYQYYKVLEDNAFGNFKDFVHEVGLTPAMLVFLNGYQNTKLSPNENYARELYELFTLGADNGYTQDDIVETARALTGHVGIFVYCDPIAYIPSLHDENDKTIFGQTGNWGYDDVIDILFDQRADEIATHVCTALYQQFISPEVDATIIADLAQTFKDNNFELEPVYRQLFKSEHLFDEENIGVIVKDPMQYFLMMINEGNFSYDNEIITSIIYFASVLGQVLFDPLDVAGWPGNRAWISTNTLTWRWTAGLYYAGWLFENDPDALSNLAIALAGDDTVNDPDFVVQVIVDHLVPSGFQSTDEYDRGVITFKDDIPSFYFTNGLWDLTWTTIPYQMVVLLNYIFRSPDYQMA